MKNSIELVLGEFGASPSPLLHFHGIHLKFVTYFARNEGAFKLRPWLLSLILTYTFSLSLSLSLSVFLLSCLLQLFNSLYRFCIGFSTMFLKTLLHSSCSLLFSFSQKHTHSSSSASTEFGCCSTDLSPCSPTFPLSINITSLGQGTYFFVSFLF
jgi:hypothetical protein